MLVGENRIYSIPPHIGMMDSLSELYINDNQDLHRLPMELSYCKNLQILSIEGCPLSEIPKDFLSGPSMVMQYLRFLVRNQCNDFWLFSRPIATDSLCRKCTSSNSTHKNTLKIQITKKDLSAYAFQTSLFRSQSFFIKPATTNSFSCTCHV